MAENSKIEWTDHTFNAWRGCTKVSPGCAHCYAETLSKRNPKVLGEWGPGRPRVLASDEMWKQPLKWNESVIGADGHPHHIELSCPGDRRPRVFCASLADWLDDEVPIEWLARLMELVMLTPNLDWLLLTKRPQNFKRRMNAVLKRILQATCGEPCNEADFIDGWVNKCDTIPANVWIGTTVEDQTRADERIPLLLKIPAKVRFLSCEPLLGPVDVSPFLYEFGCRPHCGEHCSQDADCPMEPATGRWIIVGGESGPGARPMHPDWARALRDQCSAAGVPFFFKQWGGVKKKEMGRLLDGIEHNGFPQRGGTGLI